MNYTEKSNMAYPFLPCRPKYVYTYRIFLYTDFENLDVMTDDVYVAEDAHSSRKPDLTPDFKGVRAVRALVLCIVFLFLLLHLFCHIDGLCF